MTDKESVVWLAYRNPDKTDEDVITFVVCKHCRNKTYTMTFDGGGEYPMVKCAGCGMHIGRVGWADEPTTPVKEHIT
jgi:hypothetical protein